MRVLSEIPATVSDTYVSEQYWSSVFPISCAVLDHVSALIDDQNTVVLYSGGPRLLFNATYIEPAIFSTLSVNWHQKTLFVDPKNQILVNYTIKKLKPKNLLVLNSNLFIRYRLWSDILHDIQHFKTLTENIIVTMPILRFDFNRLKFSNQNIATELGGILVDDTVVICR